MNTPNTSSTINKHHWIVAASLAALTCGVSFGEEAKVETNDQKLLALCQEPKATTEAIDLDFPYERGRKQRKSLLVNLL